MAVVAAHVGSRFAGRSLSYRNRTDAGPVRPVTVPCEGLRPETLARGRAGACVQAVDGCAFVPYIYPPGVYNRRRQYLAGPARAVECLIRPHQAPRRIRRLREHAQAVDFPVHGAEYHPLVAAICEHGGSGCNSSYVLRVARRIAPGASRVGGAEGGNVAGRRGARVRPACPDPGAHYHRAPRCLLLIASQPSPAARGRRDGGSGMGVGTRVPKYTYAPCPN